MVFATAFYNVIFCPRARVAFLVGYILFLLPIVYDQPKIIKPLNKRFFFVFVRQRHTDQHEVVLPFSTRLCIFIFYGHIEQHKVFLPFSTRLFIFIRSGHTYQHEVIYLYSLGSYLSARGYLPLNTRSFIYICQGHIVQHKVILPFTHVIILSSYTMVTPISTRFYHLSV